MRDIALRVLAFLAGLAIFGAALDAMAAMMSAHWPAFLLFPITMGLACVGMGAALFAFAYSPASEKDQG